jgi:hypothetical protein
MLAAYMQTTDAIGHHTFPNQETQNTKENFKLMLNGGMYEHFINSPPYRAKKEADKLSYFWDKPIELFTQHIVEGTSVSVRAERPTVSLAEPALRMMAREDRMMRRMLASIFLDTIEVAKERIEDRFTRLLLPNRGSADQDADYIFMILRHPIDGVLKDVTISTAKPEPRC